MSAQKENDSGPAPAPARDEPKPISSAARRRSSRTPHAGGQIGGDLSMASLRRGSTSYRRKSGSVSHGHASNWHTRTHENEEKPAATKADLSEHVRRLEQLFTITPQRMRMIVEAFIDTLEKGLAKPEQAVPMIPTYVFGWPTGKEEGAYLAVDLGGTNLRVCHVNLLGNGKFEITQTKYRLTEEQKQEDGQKLFEFCAQCLAAFVLDHYGDDKGNCDLEEKIPLGFTFSYPCIQERIDHGVLLRWTKGFGAPGVEGKDCAELFNQALEKYNVPVIVTALINDTTGTLMSSHYVDSDTRIGVIFGTGCNAAYMEKVSNITKLDPSTLTTPNDPDEHGDASTAEMAINCEWGAFDSEAHEHLPRTKYDITIDETSNKPGEQAFEKMIAGLYLGEVFRLVICELIDEGTLFLGQNTYKLEKPYSFDTAFLSLIESDVTDELLTVTGLFSHFFGLDTKIQERQFFRRLAQLIGTRSARLSSCGIAAIVSKMGYLDKGCNVATDGSLYNKYPGFAKRLSDGLVDIFGERGRNIRTSHAEDGSGVGSAIIAAMTSERRAAGIFNRV